MEGLRTLVITQKMLSEQDYQKFEAQYKKARASLLDRENLTRKAIEMLEGDDMEYLGVTGVEDKLQEDVG